MDTVMIDKLIEILNKEVAVYEGVLKLAKNKTDVIIAGKVSELEGITKLEQSSIITLSKLEEEREVLVGQLATELNIEPSELTLKILIKQLAKEQSKKLKSSIDVLPKIFNDLRNVNDLNSKLIRSSLDYIDFSMNVLTSTGSTGNYGVSGQSEDSKKNFFDLKL
ncbi:MAG: flagellar protein FlgN [Clostridiaceae bacterium]|nr:flagellar protein FlgN [Clostridiaceae bacterium]